MPLDQQASWELRSKFTIITCVSIFLTNSTSARCDFSEADLHGKSEWSGHSDWSCVYHHLDWSGSSKWAAEKVYQKNPSPHSSPAHSGKSYVFLVQHVFMTFFAYIYMC